MKNSVRLCFLLFSIFVASNCFAMARTEGRSLEGKAAPEFSLTDLNDNQINSSEFFGKQPVLLFFWATWCPHCRTAIKELNKAAASLESKGAKIITIDLGESKSLVNSYMQEHNYNLMVLLDKNEVLVEPYAIIGVPTFFLVGKDAKIKSMANSLPEDYEKILFNE